jgi:hypothetical protein
MWYAHQKRHGYHIDIYKNRPSVDEYNDVSNTISWIRENHVVDMNEKIWCSLGGKSFDDSIIQEIPHFPLRSN